MNTCNIITGLLDKATGLPSRNTFLEEHVVPAKENDKFNHNKCVHCWGEYTDEHLGVKILPCGHVFGHECLLEMIEGPTGDLCPLCRVKLFRGDLTITIAVATMWTTIFNLHTAYIQIVKRLMKSLCQRIQGQYLLQKVPLQLVLEGPRFWAKVFVRQYTNIGSRNPKLVLDDAFLGSPLSLLPYIMVINAPMMIFVYFTTGSIKIWLSVVDLGSSLGAQYISWNFELKGMFDNPADRTTIACIAAVAVLMKELILIPLIWYCCE